MNLAKRQEYDFEKSKYRMKFYKLLWNKLILYDI